MSGSFANPTNYLCNTIQVVSIAVFTQTMKEIKFPTKQTKYDTQWKARALPAADVPTELLMKKAREEQQQQQAKTK